MLKKIRIFVSRPKLYIAIHSYIYLYRAQRGKDCPKNDQLAEKLSFEGNWEIFRTIFQARALSSDKPSSRKGIYLLYNPPINFSRRTLLDRSCIFCGVGHGVPGVVVWPSALPSCMRELGG